jgi:DNA-binding protein HU-beta
MDKPKIVNQVAIATGLDPVRAEAAVQALLDALVAALAAGESVELGDFGTFEVETAKPATSRKPARGERIRIPASKVAKFSAGAAFKGL